MRQDKRWREALEELRRLLREAEEAGEIILVEGTRDLKALRALGYGGEVKLHSRHRLQEIDLVENLVENMRPILILTDFDEEGRRLYRRLARNLELRGVRIDGRLRREFGRFMAFIGVHAIEALDNVAENLGDMTMTATLRRRRTR